MNSHDRIALALELLRKADNEAFAAGLDGWGCSVVWERLRAGGVTASTMRELLDDGLVLQGVTEGRGLVREVGDRMPVPGGLFILTPAGLERARQARRDGPKPFWDEREKVLWFRNRRVKIFKQPADSQKAVLRGFEKSEWQHCITDPLERDGSLDMKKRRRNTAERLNHDQINELLWFECDGDGGFRWWERGRDGRPIRGGPDEGGAS